MTESSRVVCSRATIFTTQPSEDTNYWEVTESYQAEREEFLSVKKGQLVELLDDSGANWMVLTIAMVTDDLQTEGFLPAQLLTPAGRCTDL